MYRSARWFRRTFSRKVETNRGRGVVGVRTTTTLDSDTPGPLNLSTLPHFSSTPPLPPLMYLSDRHTVIAGHSQAAPMRPPAFFNGVLHPGAICTKVHPTTLPRTSMAATTPGRCSVKCHWAYFQKPCFFFRVRRMPGFATMVDELLCDAWLAVSADFVGRSRGGTFSQQVHELFLERKHIAPYDIHIIHDRNVRSLSYRW
jgi:hypothetical protein